MALTSEEFRSRCVAAAALHGTGMRGLRDVLAAFGAEKTLAEAMIRGEKDQNRKNIRDLAEAVELPRAWFTDPEWRNLVPGSGEAAREPAAQTASALETDIEGETRRADSSDPHTGAPGLAIPKSAEE